MLMVVAMNSDSGIDLCIKMEDNRFLYFVMMISSLHTHILGDGVQGAGPPFLDDQCI